MTPLLTVEQAARVLNMTPDWVGRNRAALGAVKLGRLTRYPVEGIEAYLAARQIAPVDAAPAQTTRPPLRVVAPRPARRRASAGVRINPINRQPYEYEWTS